MTQLTKQKEIKRRQKGKGKKKREIMDVACDNYQHILALAK